MNDDTKCMECQCCSCANSHNKNCNNCISCDKNLELRQILDYSCESYIPYV